MLLEELVDGLRRQGVFKQAAYHDGDGAVFGKTVEDGVEQHDASVPEFLLIPNPYTSLAKPADTLKGLVGGPHGQYQVT